MGQLNLLLTCIVTVMTGYLGTHSAYAEPSGLPWSPDYVQCYWTLVSLTSSSVAPVSRAVGWGLYCSICLVPSPHHYVWFTDTDRWPAVSRPTQPLDP
jgi:hypothetical protein